jgi:hypothetical protein
VLYEKSVNGITGLTASTLVDTKLLDLYDYDSITVKIVSAIMTGGFGVSVFIQTTDDEGSRWYDCGMIGLTAANTSATASFMTIPIKVGYAAAITSAEASLTKPNNTMTQLPLLSPLVRIYHVVAGPVTALGITTTISANNQDRA